MLIQRQKTSIKWKSAKIGANQRMTTTRYFSTNAT